MIHCAARPARARCPWPGARCRLPRGGGGGGERGTSPQAVPGAHVGRAAVGVGDVARRCRHSVGRGRHRGEAVAPGERQPVDGRRASEGPGLVPAGLARGHPAADAARHDRPGTARRRARPLPPRQDHRRARGGPGRGGGVGRNGLRRRGPLADPDAREAAGPDGGGAGGARSVRGVPDDGGGRGARAGRRRGRLPRAERGGVRRTAVRPGAGRDVAGAGGAGPRTASPASAGAGLPAGSDRP